MKASKIVLLSIEGEEANGKTTLAYTMPTPIVGFQFDMGMERAIYGFRNDLFKDLRIKIVKYQQNGAIAVPSIEWGKDWDIVIYECPPPIQIDNKLTTGMVEIWAYFIQNFVAAIQDPSIASIVVDTMTIARRIKADAHLQHLQEINISKKETPRVQLIQIEWGNPNDAIRDIWTTMAGVEKNFAAVHHLTDVRKDVLVNKPGGYTETAQILTGERQLEGLNNTYRYADVAIRMEKTTVIGQGTVLSGYLKKCGYNLALEGIPIANPTWDKICNLITDSLGGRIQLPLAHREGVLANGSS